VRRDALLALAVLAAGWAATLWLPPFDNERVNDLFVYRQLAGPLVHGGLPYRDAFLEYPPLAAPAIALPGVLGTGAEAFRAAFAGWTLLLAAACVLLTGALAARSGGSRRTALLAVAGAPLLCGAMLRTHFDLAPVALLLAALLALCDERPRLGLALLGLATLTKGFPLLAAAPALAWLAARRGNRVALEAAAALVVVIAVGVAFAIAASPSGAVDAVRYQLDRPVQIESSPAGILLALDAVGAGQARSVSSFRSNGLEHPAAGLVAAAFAALLAVALALLARAAYRRPDPRALVLAALATGVAYAVLGKVLSPQYLIWAVPLGALALAWREYALAAAATAAIVLTQLEFPARYFDVVDREALPLALVAARNLVLLAVLGLALRALSRPAPAAARSTLPDRRRRPRSAPRSATDPLPRSRTSPG
jgi:uncharacterized membrane protein